MNSGVLKDSAIVKKCITIPGRILKKSGSGSEFRAKRIRIRPKNCVGFEAGAAPKCLQTVHITQNPQIISTNLEITSPFNNSTESPRLISHMFANIWLQLPIS